MSRMFGNRKLPKGIYIDGDYVKVRIFHNHLPIIHHIGPKTENGIIDAAIEDLGELRKQIRAGTLGQEQAVKKLTLEKACAIYWEEEGCKTDCPNAVEKAIEYIKKFINPFRTIDTLTYLDTQTFRQSLAALGLKESSINRHHVVFTRIFNALREWRKLKKIPSYLLPEDNPGKGVRSCPGSCKASEKAFVRTTVMSPEELDKFCSFATDKVRRACYGAVLTLLRKKDLKGLIKTRNIDGSGERLRGIQAKTGKTFDVPIDDEIKSLVESGTSSEVFQFTNFRKEFEKARRLYMEAGGKHFQFRDLRRTGASELLNAGYDIRTIQKRLGHASMQMTEKYLQPTEQAGKDAAKTLSARFGAGLNQLIAPHLKVVG